MEDKQDRSMQGGIARGVIWLLLAIASGVAGNFAYEQLVEIVPRFSEYIQLYSLGIIIGLLVLVAGLCFGLLYISGQSSEKTKLLTQKLQSEQEKLDQLRQEVLKYTNDIQLLQFSKDAAQRLFAADCSLFRFLPELVASASRDVLAQEVAHTYLRDIREVFNGVVVRAIILRPNIEQTYLESWASYDISVTNLHNSKFYIGADASNARPRGVAGEVYITRRLRVVRFSMAEERWVADDPAYYPFTGEKKGPNYRSTVIFPIVNSATDAATGHCFGVICINSTEIGAFDSNESQDLLYLIANRIWTLIAVSENIRQQNPDASRTVG